MDDDVRNLSESLQRMRALAGDVAAAITTLHDLQVQISAETTYLADCLARRSNTDRAQSLQQMRRLSSAVSRSSAEVERLDLQMRLELPVINSRFPQHGSGRAT